jgi:valyl-tRNA synthetase
MIFSGLNYTASARSGMSSSTALCAMRRAERCPNHGNGIDPLEVIAEYGADALRLALVTGISAGNDTRFTDERSPPAATSQ